MTKNFRLSISTPDGSYFDDEAVEVNLPGTEGRFGVLANHMNFIASLDPGVVEIKQDGKTSIMVIFDGIAEINQEGCTVLVDKAQDKPMDKDTLESTIGQCEHDFRKETNPSHKELIKKEIKYLKAIAEAF